VVPAERYAALLAFCCNFLLLGSYYILRPIRDTVATIVGVGHLQQLFSATFLGTLLAAAAYTVLASRVRLTRLLPGLFWCWLINVLLFAALFRFTPGSPWLGAAYYVWFSVANLFMVSVFWSLMVDVFSPTQATRWFALIAGGGALGGIAGPVLTHLLVQPLGLSGLMLLAAAGFSAVIVLLHLLIRQKAWLRVHCAEAQHSTLERSLGGGLWEGWGTLLRSRYVLTQAAFILLMTWVGTIAYFCQTDLVAHAYSGVGERARALADIDLVVNVSTAAVLLFGLGRFLRRFGVTASLLLNPLLLIGAFTATLMSPTLLMIQLLQIVRRVGQYAVARPSREVCFTVVEQGSRYKAKALVDTVVYRFGDVSAAWLQDGLMSLGYGLEAALVLGILSAATWSAVAAALGSQYRRARGQSEHELAAGARTDLRAPATL
jgi:ATP:ADP antiporter, AAA family